MNVKLKWNIHVCKEHFRISIHLKISYHTVITLEIKIIPEIFCIFPEFSM